MSEKQNSKQYDLEERTYKFAENCRNFVKILPKTQANIEYGKQLIRSSGSQASNYIEANEAETKKEFLHRMRISRKETKESSLWLRLSEPNEQQKANKEKLIQEAKELRNIFNAIIRKSE